MLSALVAAGPHTGCAPADPTVGHCGDSVGTEACTIDDGHILDVCNADVQSPRVTAGAATGGFEPFGPNGDDVHVARREDGSHAFDVRLGALDTPEAWTLGRGEIAVTFQNPTLDLWPIPVAQWESLAFRCEVSSGVRVSDPVTIVLEKNLPVRQREPAALWIRVGQTISDDTGDRPRGGVTG